MKNGENKFMHMALELAQEAASAGEVPVGAVIVDARGQVLALARNKTENQNDPTAHAELLAVREACRKQNAPRLEECDLYVTLEPCAMCAAALSFARVRRVYYGAYDPKGGAVDHGPKFFSQATCHHRPEIYGGIMEAECARVLQEFFQKKR
jgi:tRNA(adenine34) deaminase